MVPDNPVSLDKLPEYLKNHRNGQENSPVVGMGQIVAPRRKWPQRVIFAAATCMLLGVVGAGIISWSPKDVTVVIAATDANPDSIANMVSVGGGKVVSVTQTENDTYEVKMSLRRNVNSFLEWLRKNKDVKRAELGE
jgi:hypothetical protein